MTGIDDKSIDEMEARKTVEPEEDDTEGMLYISTPHFNPIAIYLTYACPHNTHNSPYHMLSHHNTPDESLYICI
jgi:hypothetical protein